MLRTGPGLLRHSLCRPRLATLRWNHAVRSMGHVAYLGIGSNVGDRVHHIQEALKHLGTLAAQCRVTAVSFLYQTPAAEVTDQPQFLNCACRVETDFSPTDLLKHCKQVEETIGRQKTFRWGPREIDVDIIFYDEEVLDLRPETDLIVPHARCHQRAFMLGPVCDISPDMLHPRKGKPLKQLLEPMSPALLERVFPLQSQVHRLDGETLIMGILNVTPDSFSDGGKHATLQAAVKRAQEMVQAGVDILDIGGQSTRPHAATVPRDMELERVIPVIEALRVQGISTPISVDTFRSEVAAAAIAAGADMINDVSGGLLDDRMLTTAAKLAVPTCLMHYRGNPDTMMELTQYGNVVEDVAQHLTELARKGAASGMFPWNIILDPGIGFAKTAPQSIACLRETRRFAECNASQVTRGRHALLLGPSRKSFIGKLLADPDASSSRRVWGTAAACCSAVHGGANILRVHDAAEMRDVKIVADAVVRGFSWELDLSPEDC